MKHSVLNIALASLILPVSSFGLGLGDIQIYSSLNQPLVAEINLIDISNIPLSDIRVKIAGVDEYERAGLSKENDLDELSFKISKDAQNRPILKINSTKNIDNPYLDVIIDMAWSNGQIYKEYTLLLDPPGYNVTSSRTKPVATSKPYNKPEILNAQLNTVKSVQSLPESIQTTHNLTKTEPLVQKDSYPSTIASIEKDAVSVKISPDNSVLSSIIDNLPDINLTAAGQNIKSEQVLSKNETNNNLILQQQIASLQKSNAELQHALSETNRMILNIKQRVDGLYDSRPTIQGQFSEIDDDTSNPWSINLIMILISLLSGGAGAFIWHKLENTPLSSVKKIKKSIKDTANKAKDTTYLKDKFNKVVEVTTDRINTIKSNFNKKDQKIGNYPNDDVMGAYDDSVVALADDSDAALTNDSDAALTNDSDAALTNDSDAALTNDSDAALTDDSDAALTDEHIIDFNNSVEDLEPIHSKEDSTITDEPKNLIDFETDVNVSNESNSDFKETEDEFLNAFQSDDIDVITEPLAENNSETESVSSEDNFLLDFNEEDIDKSPKPKSKNPPMKRLLNLAKSYIDMGDIVSAKMSLEEVIERGDELTRQEAQQLLDELK